MSKDMTEAQRIEAERHLARYSDPTMSPAESDAIAETLRLTGGGDEAVKMLGSNRYLNKMRAESNFGASVPMTPEGLGRGRFATMTGQALRYRLDPLLESLSGPRAGVNIPGLARYSTYNPLRLTGGEHGLSVGGGAGLEESRRRKRSGPRATVPPALMLPILRYLLEQEGSGQTPTP
jgi:hypothetical protein